MIIPDHTEWSFEVIHKVAQALTDILFPEGPAEAVKPVILYGAAIALETIGHEIAKNCEEGTTIELPPFNAFLRHMRQK